MDYLSDNPDPEAVPAENKTEEKVEEILYKPSGARFKSDVWNSFQLCHAKPNQARCIICKEWLHHAGGNTSTLKYLVCLYN